MGNLFLLMAIKSMENQLAGPTCESVTTTLPAAEKSIFPVLFKNISGNRIRQLREVGVSRTQTRRRSEVQGHLLPLPAIFDSLIVPFDIILAIECIFQLFILGH